jgi:hypothetical protein
VSSAEVNPVSIWKFFLGFAVVVAPTVAFSLAVDLIHGQAQMEYFAAVSQILPVLLLALAIEQRYFTQRPSTPHVWIAFSLGTRRIQLPLSRLYVLQARVAILLVLVILGLGEWVAVEALATGTSDQGNLKMTAGSLAAGFTALIVSALVGTKQTSE